MAALDEVERDVDAPRTTGSEDAVERGAEERVRAVAREERVVMVVCHVEAVVEAVAGRATE